MPSRLVSSAKSWLCHGNVDQHMRILPWGADQEIPKVSPVEATAAYLSHIKKAWNSLQEDEDCFLENQLMIITVPASFDEVARDLTLEGAKMAGLDNVTLIEEPLAAFYNWLIYHEKDWPEHIKEDDLILICDVGGGTTDFTLITLKEVDGHPRFERIAVGDHLILGGDNVDIALANAVEKQMGKSTAKLSAERYKSLCSQCREAKEKILDGMVDSKRISLIGQGSRLIAGTISATLDREKLEDIVLNTFFPLHMDRNRIQPQQQRDISDFGLPYESEQAITRHIGYFLDRHKSDALNILNRNNCLPNLVLFNGGSLKSPVVQNRILHFISRWFNSEEVPKVLENREHDLAVAKGAAYYGMVKTGEGVRVGSGSARGYYLEIGKSDADHKRHAVCLVERGLMEGSVVQLKDKTFEVLTNQPVRFDVYSSSFRSGDKCGDIVEIDASLSALPPIQTIIQFGQKGNQKKIPVGIEAEYTEVGTLGLWCKSLISPHRWQLQFDLRKTTSALKIKDEAIFEEQVMDKVRKYIQSAFNDPEKRRTLETSVKDIKNLIGLKKEQWPLSFIRHISDELLKNADSRKKGPLYEKRWLNLMGYCLRPGFGEGFDEHRMRKLWKIHGQGPIKGNNAQVRSEWWIMWRRVAGGLNAGQQKQFLIQTSPLIFQKKGKIQKLSLQEQTEIWMAVANMERLQVDEKIKWAGYLLDQINPKKYKIQHFWILSRFGARELLYGSVDRVVPPDEVWLWIENLMSQEWKNTASVIDAIRQMARKTGDRTRDIDDERIRRIISWILEHGGNDSSIGVLEEVVPVEKQEEDMIFGESLPIGLMLCDGA